MYTASVPWRAGGHTGTTPWCVCVCVCVCVCLCACVCNVFLIDFNSFLTFFCLTISPPFSKSHSASPAIRCPICLPSYTSTTPQDFYPSTHPHLCTVYAPWHYTAFPPLMSLETPLDPIPLSTPSLRLLHPTAPLRASPPLAPNTNITCKVKDDIYLTGRGGGGGLK